MQGLKEIFIDGGKLLGEVADRCFARLQTESRTQALIGNAVDSGHLGGTQIKRHATRLLVPEGSQDSLAGGHGIISWGRVRWDGRVMA